MAKGANTQLTNANPADKSSLFSALMFMMNQNKVNTDGMLCAQVVSFDRVANTAVIKPMISWVSVTDEAIPRHQLVSIPVLSIGGGGFHISFPISEGDLGWILAGDRDMELFKQSLSESKPNTGRLKSFADGLFIPDVFRKYTINGADSSAMVIQSTDGSTRIAVGAGTINITAPGSVTVDTPSATFTNDVSINGNLETKGNSTTTGQTSANGGFTAAESQPCTLPGGTTVGGIDVSSHGTNNKITATAEPPEE